MESPIFICGFPKSGTTLLTQLFNNLPSIFIDIELHFAPFFLKMIDDTLISGEITTTVKKPDPLATRILELSKNNFEGYYEWCREAFRELHTGYAKGLRWGNNCKPTIDSIPTLRTLFPDAIIINMLRDPRDVWASIKCAKWKGLEFFNDMPYFLSRYRRVYELAQYQNVTTLLYENLIIDPQSAFDLIGETYNPNCLKDTGKIFRYRTLPLGKTNFDDGIYTSRIGRFVKDLPSLEIVMLEDAFSDIIEKHFTWTKNFNASE